MGENKANEKLEADCQTHEPVSANDAGEEHHVVEQENDCENLVHHDHNEQEKKDDEHDY